VLEEGREHDYAADEAYGVAEERGCEAGDGGGEVEGGVSRHLRNGLSHSGLETTWRAE